MARSTTIIGLDRLNKKLKKLPEQAEKRIKEAMEQGANEIVAMMKSLAPEVSGDLRDSIGWTWGERPKYSQALATVKSSDGKLALTIYAGNSKVRYAHLVEFGTAAHDIYGKRQGFLGRRKAMGKDGRFGTHVKHPGATAKPFFFVSWRALRRRTKSRITRAITKSAKEAAAGGG